MAEYIKNRKDSLDAYIEEYEKKYKDRYEEYSNETQEKIEKEEEQEEQKEIQDKEVQNEETQEMDIEEGRQEEIQEKETQEEEEQYERYYHDIDIQRNNSSCVSVNTCVVSVESSKNERIEAIEGVVSLVPVVLAQFELQMNIISNNKLPENVIEIKNVDNNIKITQCILLQTTDVLFVKGYVRKNIEYTTSACSKAEGVCGDIKQCIIDIPFKCSTSVEFNGTEPAKIIPNIKVEFEYHKVYDLPNQFAEKDELMSSDFSEYNQESTEYFNRLPYCNLISAKVVEANEYINRYRRNKGLTFEEKEFDEIEQKMVVYIKLELLQERNVLIPPKYL